VQEDHLERFSQYAYYGDLYRCEDCGLVAQKPNHETAEIIERLEKESYLDEKIGHLNVEEKHVQFKTLIGIMKEFTDLKDKSVFDVGANTGVFLNQMKEYTSKLGGLEPSKEAVQSAKESFGLNIQQGVTENLKESREQYDVITLWDVIEHLYDPKKDLGILRDRLKPETGILFLSTHNIGDLWPKLAGKHYPMYMYQHFYHFSTETLSKMLENAGYKVLGTRFFCKSWSVRYLHELIEKNWPSNQIAKATSNLLAPVMKSDSIGKARIKFPLRHFFVMAAMRPAT
jgi:2-polyprenyl-3-methyl-5-hydroxy-6-metoxy-1,4-benzoquinol methylase